MDKPSVLSDVAYLKLVLHCAKYPDRSVNGLLLGKELESTVQISDCIPLFHQHTTAPMLEAAVQMVRDRSGHWVRIVC